MVTDHGLVVIVEEVVTGSGRPSIYTFSVSCGASGSGTSSGFSPILISSWLTGASITGRIADDIGS